MKNNPRSFRLTDEAAENLEWAAEYFHRSKNDIINLLLTDRHKMQYLFQLDHGIHVSTSWSTGRGLLDKD